MARRRRTALYRQVLVLQVAIVALALVAAGAGSYFHTRSTLREQYGERALAVTRVISLLPEVQQALREGDPGGELQTQVEQIRVDTGMSYIAVADRRGVRFTHPNPARIGEVLSTDPADALAGKTVVTTETGTLGTSVRAKVPIHDPNGVVIGLVSAGVLVTEIGAVTARTFWTVALYGFGALTLGLLGSWIVARRLRSSTFGMGTDEIATLYENREAMLLGIREGLVTVDRHGRVTLVNLEARRLLDLEPGRDVTGEALVDVIGHGPMLASVEAGGRAEDVTLVANNSVLVFNSRPVDVRGRHVGAVITLRDRTELETLVRELANAQGMAQALRAKAHEHSNRMHTIAGLIELGEFDQVSRFVTRETRLAQSLTEAITQGIGDPVLNAVLLAKAALASEHGIELRVTRDEALITAQIINSHDVVTVVGNLVDNAIDAVLATGRPGTIDVWLHAVDDALVMRIADTGVGVPDDVAQQIFEYGFSTKESDERRGRGIGLALVSDIVRRHGGTIGIGRDGDEAHGAVFDVWLPSMVGSDRVGVG